MYHLRFNSTWCYASECTKHDKFFDCLCVWRNHQVTLTVSYTERIYRRILRKNSVTVCLYAFGVITHKWGTLLTRLFFFLTVMYKTGCFFNGFDLLITSAQVKEIWRVWSQTILKNLEFVIKISFALIRVCSLDAHDPYNELVLDLPRQKNIN